MWTESCTVVNVPNCRKHHHEFHIRLTLAGVDLRYTSDEQERLRRAKKAWLTYQLMREEYREAESREQSCRNNKKTPIVEYDKV